MTQSFRSNRVQPSHSWHQIILTKHITHLLKYITCLFIQFLHKNCIFLSQVHFNLYNTFLNTDNALLKAASFQFPLAWILILCLRLVWNLFSSWYSDFGVHCWWRTPSAGHNHSSGRAGPLWPGRIWRWPYSMTALLQVLNSIWRPSFSSCLCITGLRSRASLL